MANSTELTPIQKAWVDFIESLRQLLNTKLDNRALDQYLEFRDEVLKLALKKEFLDELQKAWLGSLNFPDAELGDILLLELRKFPHAVDVAHVAERAKKKPNKDWADKWLERASTVIGSIKDLINKLPPWAQGVITILKELIDLFK